MYLNLCLTMWVKLCQNTTFYLTNTISLRDRLIYFVKISHESIIITISNWKLIITMPLYVESDFRWNFMCKFKESVKWKRNKIYCRKKFEWNLIAFLLSVFFVDNNILFSFLYRCQSMQTVQPTGLNHTRTKL